METNNVIETRTWRLDGPSSSLVLASFDQRLPVCIHWGQSLPMGEDLDTLALALAPPLPHGTLDRIAEPSLCPEQGWAYPGEPGIKLADATGKGLLTQFRVTESQCLADRITINAVDQTTKTRLSLHLTMMPETGVITAETEISNQGEHALQVLWLTAPALPPPDEASHFLDYAGRWTKELNEHWVAFQRGVHKRESRRGRPGHDHFPGLVVAPRDGSLGKGCGWHLGWSGNHRLTVETLPDGRRLVQFGEALEPGEIQLAPGEPYRTPPLYLACSDRGINGLTQAFQDHVRHKIVTWPAPDRPHPVHYNCWEAVYFNHDLTRLKALADKAAALGAERFVLDDGWFSGRHDDTSSLGDWYVDPVKYPNGLTPLIDHVERLGMSFGLWVEPEMVNPNSDLARAHPDWIIQPSGYEPILGRHQHVLDLTQKTVADYLFERLTSLLSSDRIDYLKWDMNRDLALALDRQGRALCHRQTKALYRLLAKLRERHPTLDIESCASGGGRIDYGILRYTQRVWLSDSNDAHERWRMQQAAMTFLPPAIIGSHVGPSLCHTSDRQLSMAFRAAVAMTGNMGFEMDLDELTDEETERLKASTAFYKAHRAVLHNGRQYRLRTGAAHTIAQLRVAQDQSRFLLFYARSATDPHEGTLPLRFQGLIDTLNYRLQVVAPDLADQHAMRQWPSPLACQNTLSLSGRMLMTAGVTPPNLYPDTMLIVYGST